MLIYDLYWAANLQYARGHLRYLEGGAWKLFEILEKGRLY